MQRQLDGHRVQFQPADRGLLAALLHRLPRPSLRRLRLLMHPDTVLRWHRQLLARRHAARSRPRRCGRPRDRDGKYPPGFDTVLADSGMTVVRTGVRIPRMNAVMERWVRSLRRELLDRMLIWNQRHLLHALREYEAHYNAHRPHQGIRNARPLAPLPERITEPDRLAHLHIHRYDRLGGVLHEYRHAA